MKHTRSENVRESLRRNLMHRRVALSLSQESLARKAGLSRPVISMLEQGRANPTLSILEKTAKAVGYAVVDLLKPNAGASTFRRRSLPRFSPAGRKPSYTKWLANPPDGSKTAAAREFGIDLTLLIENLALTPAQRLRKLAVASATLEKLRSAKAGRVRRRS